MVQSDKFGASWFAIGEVCNEGGSASDCSRKAFEEVYICQSQENLPDEAPAKFTLEQPAQPALGGDPVQQALDLFRGRELPVCYFTGLELNKLATLYNSMNYTQQCQFHQALERCNITISANIGPSGDAWNFTFNDDTVVARLYQQPGGGPFLPRYHRDQLP